MTGERGTGAGVVRLVAIAVAMLASAAFAQADAPTGFKVGDGRFHLGASLSFGYDSYVGNFPVANTTPVQFKQEGDLLLIPSALVGFDLDTKSTGVHFNGSAGYYTFLGALSGHTPDASHIDANLGLQTAFNRDGPVEVQLGDNLVRSDRTQNVAIGIGVLSLYNNARLGVPIHPGGGALEITPNVAWSVEFFEPLLGGSSNTLNTMNYSALTGGLGARWRFLPKTALVFDGNFVYQSYWQGPVNPDAGLLKAQIGLAGLISTKLSVLAMIGWGFDFIGQKANTLIAQAEISFLLNEFFTTKFGYVRTLAPVPVFGAYQDDRGYAELRFTVARFFAAITGGVDYLTFYKLTAADVDRHDLLANVTVGPGVRILPWLTVSANYSFYYRTVLDPKVMMMNTALPTDYQRHVAMLNVSAYY